jgi:hypothetical protein
MTTFNTYSTNFSTFSSNFSKLNKDDPDSLKNIISKNDLSADAVGGGCKVESKDKVTAYTDSTWDAAAKETDIPKSIPISVNSSHSLRCILEDMVDWQKLGLSLQIHSLLKTYIADAQTVQLKNQLVGKIAAAEMEWANSGQVITGIDGTVSKEAVYTVNSGDTRAGVAARGLDYAINRISTAPGQPGSLGIPKEWSQDAAASVAEAMKDKVSNSSESDTPDPAINNYIDMTNPNTFFDGNFNDPSNKMSGMDVFNLMVNDQRASPLGVQSYALQNAADQLDKEDEQMKFDKTASGFSNNIDCGEMNPYCLYSLSTVKSPKELVAQDTAQAAGSGLDALESSQTLDGTPDNAQILQTTEIADKGLRGFDGTGLRTSKTVVNKLVREFYDAIGTGYFGISADTSNWAQATMLSIYDEMEFNASSTQTVVTNGKDSAPTDYGDVQI